MRALAPVPEARTAAGSHTPLAATRALSASTVWPALWRLAMSFRAWRLAVVGLLLAGPTALFAEDITITTYYPSPRGVYNGLRTNTLYLRGGDGDVNGDGVIDNTDVTVAQQCAAATHNPPEECAIVDVNGDGLVNQLDIDLLNAMVANGGTLVGPADRAPSKRIANFNLPMPGNGDFDVNGSISIDELLKAVACSLGQPLAAPFDFPSACRIADIDGDGLVTWPDLWVMVEHALNGGVPDNTDRQRIALIRTQGGTGDFNANGTIDVNEEIAALNCKWGTPPVAVDPLYNFDGACNIADVNGDGLVNDIDIGIIASKAGSSLNEDDHKLARLIGNLSPTQGGSGHFAADGTTGIFVNDINAASKCWGGVSAEPWKCPIADINGDGVVNPVDIEIMAQAMSNNGNGELNTANIKMARMLGNLSATQPGSGHLNGDGVDAVDVSNAITCMNAAFSANAAIVPQPAQCAVYDINGDGLVNQLDLEALQAAVGGQINPADAKVARQMANTLIMPTKNGGGAVGIGTTLPPDGTFKLEVNGAVKYEGPAGALQDQIATTKPLWLVSAGTISILPSPPAPALPAVGIGLDQANGTPLPRPANGVATRANAVLQVGGAIEIINQDTLAGFDSLYLTNPADGGKSWLMTHVNSGPLVWFRDNGGGTLFQAMTLDNSGNLFCNNCAVFSDVRLKQHVKPLQGALEQLLSLRGVNFEWKEPTKHGNRTGTQVGLIAQEVEKVFPQWVITSPDGYKALNFSGQFEGLTVEAVRTLKQENDELKKKVTSLEARLSALEQHLNAK